MAGAGIAEGEGELITVDTLLTLSPKGFEELVARYLESVGYAQVEVTGGAGDLGVDIRWRNRFDRLVVVQCKRYGPGAKIGSPQIQHFFGMIVHAGAAHGIFVTSQTFTAPAIALAQARDIELISGKQIEDYRKLLEMERRRHEELERQRQEARRRQEALERQGQEAQRRQESHDRRRLEIQQQELRLRHDADDRRRREARVAVDAKRVDAVTVKSLAGPAFLPSHEYSKPTQTQRVDPHREDRERVIGNWITLIIVVLALTGYLVSR